jgi:hypothetical protein
MSLMKLERQIDEYHPFVYEGVLARARARSMTKLPFVLVQFLDGEDKRFRKLMENNQLYAFNKLLGEERIKQHTDRNLSTHFANHWQG